MSLATDFIVVRQPQALTSCIRSDFRCQPHQRSDVRFPFKIIFNLHLNSNAPYKSLARWVYPMRYGKCGNLCGKCGNFYSAPRNEYGCRSEWTLRKAEWHETNCKYKRADAWTFQEISVSISVPQHKRCTAIWRSEIACILYHQESYQAWIGDVTRIWRIPICEEVTPLSTGGFWKPSGEAVTAHGTS